MKSQHNCWLLLEKSDETRISKSISSYNDRTGEEYNYDNLVPNHRNVRPGDLAIVRKEDRILGYGVVGDIKQWDAVKTHKRCPNCRSTDIRERKKKSPIWKCGHCADEFSGFIQTDDPVRNYTAAIKAFIYFENPPDVQSVKSCAAGNGLSAQNSILGLDFEKLRAVLDGVELPPAIKRASGQSPGQGIGLSPAERRAVELHAMQVATALYREMGWEVADKSSICPYDLIASKEGQRRFIEVKGSTGAGLSVLLTHGEVKHATQHGASSVLVVVAHIQLRHEDNGWAAWGGGIVCHQSPWLIDSDSLSPTQFRYAIPDRQTEEQSPGQAGGNGNA